jgi:hypothetical protein
MTIILSVIVCMGEASDRCVVGSYVELRLPLVEEQRLTI